jgi:hypothetical protein
MTSVFLRPRAVSLLGEIDSPRAPMRVGRAEHQILYARQAPAKRFHAPPLKPGSWSDPTGLTGRVSRGERLERYAFNSAPSGTTPVSRYRHSAMITRRANATMPMRRVTAPPLPKRRWYHCVSALVG